MSISGLVLGQQSITQAGVATNQNFDGMGTSGTADLPSGFKIGTDWSSGTAATTLAYGTTGTGAVTGTSGGGAINWANGITASSTERALGFLSSSGYTSPRSIIYAFTNNTGNTITSIDLSWNYEKYRSGSRAFAWTFFHGSTSTASTAATSGNHSYAADANNTVISNPPLSVSKSFSITGLSIVNGSTYYLRWTYTGDGGSTNAQGLGIDDFSITLTSGSPPPLITVTPATLTSFTYVFGAGPSVSQTYNLSGSNLAEFPGNITVSGSTNYEVSTDNSNFAGSVLVPYLTSTLASTPIYVRLKSGLAAGNYNSETITNAGGGATSQNVTVSGSVSAPPPPTISATPASLLGFTYVFSSGPSSSQTYNLSGSNLTGFPGNITVSGSTNYEVSTDNSNFAGSVLVPYLTSTLASTPIYVRLKSGLAVGNYNSETITNAGGGATSQNVTVSGSVTAPPPPTITVTPTSLSGFSYVFGAGPSTSQTYNLSGSNLTGFPGNITVSGSTNYEVSTNNSNFAGSVLVPYLTSTLASTPIYVRLKSGLAVGNYNSETITNAGGGATSQNVTVSGSVTAPPPPVAPLANAASGTDATSFTANWGASAGATGYFLDVYTKTAGGNATDLFISEYIEGSSNNKAIEIYNGTGATVDLSVYSLRKQSNGAGAFVGDLPLSGTLLNGEVYVIAHSSANATILAQADQTAGSSPMDFNGNDAVALYKSGVQIDVVGIVNQVSPDWGANVTLVRKSSISGPTTSYSVSDWDSYASDTFTYLGSHTFSSGSSSSFVAGYENLDVASVTSYEVTGLNPNTTYYYLVRAANAYGTSGNSNEIEVTTLEAVGLPVVENPSVASVGESAAVLGGEIISDGGSAITERGTVWSLTPGVTINNNKLAEGGTSTGIFSHSRTGLPSGTTVYFRAYAINANGTTLSEEDSFTTFATEPPNHASGFSGTLIAPTQNSITLTWTNPSPASESYLIKGVEGVGQIADPADGVPEADALLVKNLNANVESYTFPGLTPETTYTFKIYPYNGTGTSINYLVTGAPSATATTAAVVVQTYTWIGADAGSWATATNWSPSRTSPHISDILQFNDGATKTITGVTSQTIGKISVSNNTKITLQASSTVTLTIAGGTGHDLLLGAGSELNASGSNAILIALSTGATASIDGAMTFAGGAHKLTAADAGGITFNNGASFTAGTGFSGNAFNNITENSIIFASGSTYRFISGSNPFALTAPASVIVFQTGSTYQQLSSSAPSVNGRTYANFEYNFNGTLSISGSIASSIDNLIVSQGTLNVNVTGLTAHSIKGNIVVNSGATLTFSPASAGTISLNGTSQQTISGAGTLSSNSNSTLNLNNSAGIVLNTNATLGGNLTIEASSALTVNTGRNLTVSGTLTNNAGNTGLVIKSNASGTGSLLHNSNNVPATIERYITGNTVLQGTYDYHLVSVPLNAGVTAAQFLGSYLYRFDVALQQWHSLGTSLTTPLANNQGYMIFYPNTSTTYNFVGQLNNGNFTAATPITAVDHFALVPNPYPSAIDWDAASGWTKTNIRDAIWIWNPVTDQYATYGGDVGVNAATRYIPAGQAFFVKSNAASPVLSMNNNVRVHNSQAFFKSGQQMPDLLRIHAHGNNKTDEIVLRLREGSLIGLDDFDVDKLFGAAIAPQLFTTTPDGRELAINNIPADAAPVSIPMGFQLQAGGQVSLSFEGLDTFKPSLAVMLEDLLTGTTINLRETPTYSFNHSITNSSQRFMLHLTSITSLDDNWLSGSRIWTDGRDICIAMPETESQSLTIELFDPLGRNLATYRRSSQPFIRLSAPASGVMLVRISNDKGAYSSKVFIR